MSGHPLVDRLRARYSAYDWVPADLGRTSAEVWRLTGRHDLFVKVAAVSELPQRRNLGLVREREAMQWLAGHGIPVPEVVEAGVTGDGFEFLVSTALPGRAAAEPWPETQRLAVTRALARFTTRLHALPVSDCPVDMGLTVTVPLARERLKRGLVVYEWLSPQRQGLSASRLEELLTAAAAASPAEDQVVCHGDFSLSNILVDPDTMEVSGVVDVSGLGVADRYSDLSMMAWDLSDVEENPQYGPAYARKYLLWTVGSAVDREKMSFYELLWEFM